MPKAFKVQPFDEYDKFFFIEGPDQLSMRVDIDDVDRKVVIKAAKKIVAMLNKHWEAE